MSPFLRRTASSISALIGDSRFAIESRNKVAVAYASSINFFFGRFYRANYFGSTVCLVAIFHSESVDFDLWQR